MCTCLAPPIAWVTAPWYIGNYLVIHCKCQCNNRWHEIRFRVTTKYLIHINHCSKVQAAYCHRHTASVQQHTHVTRTSGSRHGVAKVSEGSCI